MTSSLTNLSAFTLSSNGSPYPLPNFDFAYSAGPDGRQFLQEESRSIIKLIPMKP